MHNNNSDIIVLIFKYVMKPMFSSSSVSHNTVVESYTNQENNMDVKTLNDLEPRNNEVLFVNFYSPMCGHCQDFKPTWNIIKQKLHKQSVNNKTVQILSVNCEDSPDIAQKYNIDSYPTIKTLTGEAEYEYEGSREENALLRYIKKQTKK